MAIFGKSKKEESAKAEEVKKDVEVTDKATSVPASTKAAQKPVHSIPGSSINVVLAPRVTEKAAILSDSGVYVFKVTPKATKPQVRRAIIDLFKVTPVKVNMVNLKGTRVLTRATGKKGRTDSIKKAYVYLKKGDKIELA